MTPAILIPYLFLTRQGRSGVRATATFCAAALLAAAFNASTSWSYWTHYIRDPQRAGMLSWIGNQGLLGATERMLGHTVTTPTSFLIGATVAVVGLAVAAAAYRRSSPVLGFLVVEATESLASPVSWSHHFIWVILLVAWLALAEDRPRYGEWMALGVSVLFWAAPTWWVPHGPGVAFAGRGWLMPVSDSYALLFIILVVGAGVRVWRAPVRDRWSAAGRRTIAPTRRRELTPAARRSAHAGPARRPGRACASPGRPCSPRTSPRGPTRQPVTTISFSGSPGRNSLRRGSPVDVRSAPVAARSTRAGPPGSGATVKPATSALPAGARARRLRPAAPSPPG